MATLAHTCSVSLPFAWTSKMLQKRYTQQVRRQSWRNPKGGILSTEVVFSICTFFLNFVFFLEVGLGEGGSLPHLCGWQNLAPGWCPACLHPVPWDSFSTFGKRLRLWENRWMFLREGGFTEEQQHSWSVVQAAAVRGRLPGVLRGLPRHLLLGEGGMQRPSSFSRLPGAGHIFSAWSLNWPFKAQLPWAGSNSPQAATCTDFASSYYL